LEKGYGLGLRNTSLKNEGVDGSEFGGGYGVIGSGYGKRSEAGSWKTTAKVWSKAQCEKIVDFPNLKAHTMTVFICKGYCNMLHRCNAINWNLLTSDCILWSCPTPIPSPSETTPSNEGYYIGHLDSGSPSNSRYLWSPNVETILRYKSNDLTSFLHDDKQFNNSNIPTSVQIVADVKVQAMGDNTLRVKLEHIKFYPKNGLAIINDDHQIIELLCNQSGQPSHGYQEFIPLLGEPILVLVKKGWAKSAIVSQKEPNCVAQIKLAIVHSLMQNGQPQNFQVIKKNAIIEPFKISTPSKKISLPMT